MMYQPRIESQSEVELLELDRRGRPTERLRLRDAMQSPRLSPSTTRVAVARTAQREAEIWIYDIPSKTFAPLADGKGSRPAWSPDERRIAFQRTAGSDVGIFTVRVDGSAAATKVASQGQTNGTPSYSRDGNWIVFDGAFEGGMGEDIYAVGTGEDRTPFPVVQSAATEEAGVVSPDGRWIAYTADETRTTQVYIRPFRREGGRWLVSAGAAAGPAWTTNNELVYQDLGAQTMVAAKLAFTPDPQILARETLFDTRGYLPSTRSIAHYDVSRDGQRFLVLRGADIFQIRSPVVVLNWREEVRRVMREQGGAR
jgi:dipeptidyl aminopeptidase/acylaminoacyl peptidase